MDIRLTSQLTSGHQAVILKYIRSSGALSQAEWVTALAAFDALSSCQALREGTSQTFAQFPLRHDFYITALFDAQSRQRRRVVMMQAVAWDKIDGDTEAAELAQAAALLPQPVAITVKGQRLIVVEYNLWKEKIRAFQTRGESNE